MFEHFDFTITAASFNKRKNFTVSFTHFQFSGTQTFTFTVDININNIFGISSGELWITYNINQPQEVTDAEGNVTMAISPDFYLPKFNLYLELTTMDQKYVTKKNKKARMVMELYPGTNVRIVYKKDFLALAERFKQFGG